jgi:Transglutaminase-like superfamily.
MKLFTGSLCMAFFLLSFAITFAQEKSPVKFGKISNEDFDLSKYKFDTSVSAVVISDIGSSKFEGNTNGGFTLVFKRQKRIKILNKNGFEAANIEIRLYTDGRNEESLDNLKAYTYNLENGNITKSELQSNSIFKDKLSANQLNKKFTFPAVKEGSIIEYSYTVNSIFFFNLQPWIFQDNYPCLWSEYQVSLPDFFAYVTIGQGYQPYYIKNQSQDFQSFYVTIPGGTSESEHVNLNSTVYSYRWVMKDVPALKEEGFTTTIRNHIAKIEFQLSQYRFPNVPVRDIMGNWKTVTEKMLEREDFGATINKANNWLDDDMKPIVAGATGDLEKAKRIYNFVRDNFTCTDHSDLYLNNSLKTIFKNKNGSVSDINLLLVAMLHHENIEADPVILSTRAHGFANDLYPLMNRYNYVIAAAKINNAPVYLDASHAFLGFGKLPSECYNGFARIIGKEPAVVDFIADSLKEEKVTSVFISNNDNGNFEGSFKTIPGYYESSDIRERIKEKGETEFFKKIKASYNSIDIMQPGIDSLKVQGAPIAIHYEFKVNDMNDDIIYFNPMMAEGYKNNFFKAEERTYPVEMPYTFDETYVLSMEVPKNYTVEEIPKSVRVNYNEDEGFFEYMINKSGDQIMLRSRVVMKKANFAPEEYNSLRDFFAYVVKKHSEQIVFKKKK